MTKWIRWPGLVFFAVLIAFAYFLFYFFIDDFVKARIEAAGSDWAHAKVELDDAHLSLFPMGLRLKRLQVTDRKAPMSNAVEIAEIAFLIDPGLALDRKIGIQEMTVDALRFNTPRTHSGALAPVPEKAPSALKKQFSETFQLPALDLPNIREILEKESLASVQRVEDLRQEIKTMEEKWQAEVAALPDKEKLKSYERRAKELKEAKKGGLGGILNGVTELSALQKEIKADLDRIQTAKQRLNADLNTLKNQVKTLPKTPLEDINRLKEKYALSPQGLSNITRMLLGEQIGGWTDTAVQGYETLQPYLARLSKEPSEAAAQKPPRGKGIDIHFRAQRADPDFLIETAKVSFQIEEGRFTGAVQQITTQQHLTGKPLTFRFTGQDLKAFEAITVDGTVNRIQPAQAQDRIHLKAQGYRIKNLSLSKGKTFPVEMKSADADFESTTQIENGILDAKLSAQIKSLVFALGLEEGAGTLAKAMAETLSDVKGFGLEAAASGPLGDYDLTLKSDWDQVVKKAVGNQVQVQAAKFEAKLKSEITEKLDKELAQFNTSFGDLDGLLGELAGRENLGDQILKDLLKKATGGFKLPF